MTTMASWATEEMAAADLGDKRLNRRLMSILSALGERPTASIPAACGGFNEMTAAYRFFDNDKAAFEPVLAPHQQRTRERIAAQETVLLVQDTTELDLTRPHQTMEGAGPLDCPSRRGAFLHPLIAFTPDGTPLGTAWAQAWTRGDFSDETRSEKQKRRRYTPIEEKESQRWLDGLRQARAIAQDASSTLCVCIADSEADIYELFSEPRGAHPVHWIVRAGQDRAVRRGADQDPNVCDVRSAVEAARCCSATPSPCVVGMPR
jgi:Transposase DNA-binding